MKIRNTRNLKTGWSRIRAILLCALIVLFACCTSFAVFTETESTSGNREQIKSRLMRQIQYQNWDPYSSDMTVEEFYALMELFEEGKLPIKQKSATTSSVNASAAESGAKKDIIPRTQFLILGLNDYNGDYAPEEYDTNVEEGGYEETGKEDAEGNPLYYYPAGLDPYNMGYRRPNEDTSFWAGVEVSGENLQALIVHEDNNKDNLSVTGNVDQKLFPQYKGHYVKRLTIDNTDIAILGLIHVPAKGGEPKRDVYYYLSTTDQSNTVSATSLPDDNTHKFVIEYVPNEFEVTFKVQLENETGSDKTDVTTDIFEAGSTWVESVFGKDRPKNTTEGAYSFDVTVPYGYQASVYINIDMTIDEPFPGKEDLKFFSIEVNHTGSREAAEKAYFDAYAQFLKEHGIANTFELDKDYTKEKDDDGRITYTYIGNDTDNAKAHQTVLDKIAQRGTDFMLHNNGYPLGMYPVYDQYEGSVASPNPNGPLTHTVNDTFYNHNVKANRTVVAVLKKLPEPTFSAPIVAQTDNTKTRGTSAIKEITVTNKETGKAEKILYDYEDELMDRDGKYGTSKYTGYNNPAAIGNIQTADTWKWDNAINDTNSIQGDMRLEEDGTYSWIWTFQTNSGDNYVLDILAINGMPINVPYFPKYSVSNTETAKTEFGEKGWATKTELADGGVVRVEFLATFTTKPQRVYRIIVTGARSNVAVTGMNLMQYGSGAAEFSIFELDGVYAGDNQNEKSIEYFDNKVLDWEKGTLSTVIVADNGKGINYDGSSNYGANIRFKIADGYGNPYYMWRSTQDGFINGKDGKPQTSLVLENGEPVYDEYDNIEYNNVIYFSRLDSTYDVDGNQIQTRDDDGKLLSQYIYYDDREFLDDGSENLDYGYYYIRVSTHESYKIALLTIIARTVRYAVRYYPDANHYADRGNNGAYTAIIETTDDEGNKNFDLTGMPTFAHSGNCPFNSEKAGEIGQQYDDNNGNYYNMLTNRMATISPVEPSDKSKNYSFENWVLLDENYIPIKVDKNGKVLEYYTEKDEYGNIIPIKYNSSGQKIKYTSYNDGTIIYEEQGTVQYKKDVVGEYIHFHGGAIDISTISDYAVHRVEFSESGLDTLVIRLAPFWKEIIHPFTYNVVLNWVDALGRVHTENFSQYWDEVLTDTPEEDDVFVFLNKEADALLKWIAQHPTYTFWDAVNNAHGEEEEATIRQALIDYLGWKEDNPDLEGLVLKLMEKNYTGGHDDEGNPIPNFDDENKPIPDFERLGAYLYAVLEDGGTVSIWMYENKGGLIFHKTVEGEDFFLNNEFYFTVEASAGGVPFTDIYKAYPEPVYTDEKGNAYVYDEDGVDSSLGDDNEGIIWNGKLLRLITDKDAWLVSFKGGRIEYIVKNGEKPDNDSKKWVSWFTLKDGEGIQLYIPSGEYSVIELGSKSGDTYKVSVGYKDSDGNTTPKDGWLIPKNDFLSGSKTVKDSSEYQVTATVKFEIGEHDVVNTLTFYNQTTSTALSLGLSLSGKLPEDSSIDYKTASYTFVVEFTASAGYEPPKNSAGQYYVNLHFYKKDATVAEERTVALTKNGNTWSLTIQLKPDEQVLFMLPSEDRLSYSVKETESHGLKIRYSSPSGNLVAGNVSEAWVTNYYEDVDGYLAITEKGGTSGDIFLFKITGTDSKGNPIELIVSVKGGGGTTYVYLPVGEYTISALDDWSWRYDGVDEVKVEVKESNSSTGAAASAEFNHSSNGMGWLGGESSKNNSYTAS